VIFFALTTGCVDSQHTDSYELKSLIELVPTREWVVTLDSLDVDLLYAPTDLGSSGLVGHVKFSTSNTCRACIHGKVTFDSLVRFTRFHGDPNPRTDFLNDSTAVHIVDGGDSCVFLSRHDDDFLELAYLHPPAYYFMGHYFDMTLLVQDRAYLSVSSGAYELRSRAENALFYDNAKPIFRTDLNDLSRYELLGKYPSDYREKGIYGYHLAPLLCSDGKQILCYSFPGSRFLHVINEETLVVTDYECKSLYHTEYQSMDTADFMMVSKAIQFQDTVSRYDRVAVSDKYQKCVRLYLMNSPAVLNGKSYNGSIVIFSLNSEKVEREYLFNTAEISPRHFLFHNEGLIVLIRTTDAPPFTYNVKDLPIYGNPL